jgi:hypothetical protein
MQIMRETDVKHTVKAAQTDPRDQDKSASETAIQLVTVLSSEGTFMTKRDLDPETLDGTRLPEVAENAGVSNSRPK